MLSENGFIFGFYDKVDQCIVQFFGAKGVQSALRITKACIINQREKFDFDDFDLVRVYGVSDDSYSFELVQPFNEIKANDN